MVHHEERSGECDGYSGDWEGIKTGLGSGCSVDERGWEEEPHSNPPRILYPQAQRILPGK